MDVASLRVKVVNEGLDATTKGLDNLDKEASRAEKSIKRTSAASEKLKRTLGMLKGVLGAAFAAAGVSSILQTANAMQELNNQIRVATNTTAEYNKAQSEIERIAMSNFASLESVGELYASNSRALKSLNKTQAETLRFTENVTKAMRIGGGSAAAQSAALTQLGQAMASGVLRGDEFNSIAEQAPVFLELLGNKLNMTTGELRAFAAEGGLTADIVYDAVAGATEKLDSMTGQTVTTMAQAIQNVKTQWGLFTDSLINTEGGIGSGIAKGVNAIAIAMQDSRQAVEEFLASEQGMAIMESTTAALKTAWEGLKAAIEVVGDVISPVVEWFREHEEVTQSLATAIGIVAGAFLAVKGAIVIATGVMAAFGAAMALVTSPVTLTIAAITGLVTAGVYLYRNWDEVKAKASEIWQGIKDTISNKVEETKQAIIDKWDSIKNTISNKAQQAIDLAKAAFNGLPGPIKDILTIAYNVVKTHLDLVKNAFSTVLNMVKALVRGDMQGVVNAFKSGMGNAWGIVKEGASNIVSAFAGLGKKLFNAGVEAVQGLINGLKSKLTAVRDTASNLARSAIDGLRGLAGFDSHSPSKKTTKAGEEGGQGVVNGLKNKTKAVKSAAQKLAETAVKSIKDNIASLQKEIALFGNDSPLASFEYDVKVGKYAGVPQSLLDKNAQLIKDKQQLIKLDKEAKDAADALAKEQQRIAQANQSVLDSVAGINRQIALFNGNDALSGLMYDIENTDKYVDVSAENMQKLIDKTKELQLLKDTKSANDAFYNMTDSMQEDNPMGRLIAERDERLAILAEAQKMEVISTKQFNETLYNIEKSYADKKRDLLLNNAQNLFGGLSGLAKSFAGEQSGIYRTLFAVEKGFAIAQAAISIQKTVAKAMEAGFPQNIPLIGQAVSQGANIISNIKSISAPVGQAHDGIMSVPKSGTWNLEKGERVLPAHTAKAMDRKLEASNDAPNVNITVNVDANGNAQMDVKQADNMSRSMANSIKAVVVDTIRKEKRQGGMLSA